MNSRQERERDFHNKSFSELTRKDNTEKYYAVARDSRKFYQDFLKKNCENKKILEYGCGPGGYSFALAKCNTEVYGIDVSDVAIDKARKTAEKENLKMSFQVMDAENLNFADKTFDIICGIGILHHLDLKRAYSEIARTIKDDGCAIFIEPIGHNPIINFYRYITPNIRTEDEHPLLMKDLNMAQTYFKRIDIHFYYLTSLMVVPFRHMKIFNKLLTLFGAIDKVLFTILPFTKRFAWTAVMVLAEPREKALLSKS